MAIEEKLVFNEDKPLIYDNTSYILTPEGGKTYLLDNPKCDAKILRLDTTFKISDATKSNYKPKVKAKLTVSYKKVDITNDVFFIVLNRDIKVSESVYKNTSTLQLQGQDIEKIHIELMNNSTESIEITGFYVYQSKDAGYYQIADVLKEQVISADIIQSTASISAANLTQYLQTNIFSLSALEGFGVGAGGTVNYAIVDGWNIDLRTTELDTITEQFSIWLDLGHKVEQVFFWYAIIGDHPDAYKFLTTIDPNEKYPDISESDREKFKFMVYKKKTDVTKFSIKFDTFPSGETGPVVTYGAGTTSDPNSLLGKGRTYKDGTGFYHEYHKQDGSDTVAVIMDDTGGQLKGFINELEYFESYPDYFVWKYLNDPVVEAEIKEENSEFKGLIINGIFKPFRKFTTNYK